MIPSSRPSASCPSATSSLCTTNSYSSDCCECAACDMYATPGSYAHRNSYGVEHQDDHVWDFQHPRQTFSFDRVLYLEDEINVTPTCINIKRDSITIETIHHVEMLHTLSSQPFIRTWKKCWRKIPVPNIILYLSNGNVRALRAQNPATLKLAIRSARSIIYN